MANIYIDVEKWNDDISFQFSTFKDLKHTYLLLNMI